MHASIDDVYLYVYMGSDDLYRRARSRSTGGEMLICLCVVLLLAVSGGYADIEAQRRLHDPKNVHNVE